MKNYIPKHILRKLEGMNKQSLNGTEDGRYCLNETYKVLRTMGNDLARKNSNYKKAYRWAMNLEEQHFSSAFTAALMVLEAGFHLPSIQARSQEIRERGVGGQFTISPYYSFTRITLSTSSYFTTMGGLDAAFEESYKQKWNSTPNCALHELCHHISFIIDSENHQMHTRMSDSQKSKAREYVSGYAKQQYCEFCAEVVSGILYGNKYDDFIIDFLPEGIYGTEKEKKAWKNLKNVGRKSNGSLGNFIPREILQNLNGVVKNKKLVTPYNFHNYNYTDEQKKSPIYHILEKIKGFKDYYRHNSVCHCAIDNFCKIMNNSFDFVLPVDYEKLSKSLMLKMKMSKALL